MDKVKSILTFKEYVIKDITFQLNPNYKNYRESVPISCKFKTNHRVLEENDNLIVVAINVQLFEEKLIDSNVHFILILLSRGFLN